MNWIITRRNGVAMCFTCLFLFSATAQKIISNQGVAWCSYIQTLQFNEQYYLQTQLHELRFMDPDVQLQTFLTTHLFKSLGADWETSIGATFSLQGPSDPLAAVKLTVPEFRPHLEFDYKQKLQYFTLDHRYRGEARFLKNTNIDRTEFVDGVDFANYRFRYRLQATLPLCKYAENKSLKVKFGDEIMLNAGEQIVINICNLNAVYACLNFDLASDLKLDLGYMNIFQQRSTGSFYDRDILLCTVSQEINLKK